MSSPGPGCEAPLSCLVLLFEGVSHCLCHGHCAAWPASVACPRPLCSMARQRGPSTATVQHGPPAWPVHGQCEAWPASVARPRPLCSMARQRHLSTAAAIVLVSSPVSKQDVVCHWSFPFFQPQKNCFGIMLFFTLKTCPTQRIRR